ncbi:MAG: cell wall metabolism sensor histidine kinase WalK [Actinomycetia bacterium]|nr:cell wall metabolism sensor histidine kinase WalK [Actinomycetes bacterium]
MIGLVLAVGLVVGWLVAVWFAPITDPQARAEALARYEQHCLARVQVRAEHEINQLAHLAFDEMLVEAERVRRSPRV